MNPESFSRMLIYIAAQRRETYQWQVRIFKQRYGGSRLFKHDLDPAPPTLLFKLELATLEAQRSMPGGSVAA